MGKPHILFVCGRNRWRSPTAERLYRSDPRLEARSAGVSDKSQHRISAADIAWADLILVMEAEYGAWIRKSAACVIDKCVSAFDWEFEKEGVEYVVAKI